MRLVSGPEGTKLLRATDFDSLEVELTDSVLIEGEIPGWGVVEGDHAWLSIERLRAETAALLPSCTWEDAFERMIDYASSRAWVSDDGATVRAHIVAYEPQGTVTP